MGDEYGCDWCGEYTPNGSGYYVGDDRLCRTCSEGISHREEEIDNTPPSHD